MPSTRTTLRVRCLHVARRAGCAALGGGHVGRRPADPGERVDARERVQDRAGRRQRLVQLARGSPTAGCPRGTAARRASGARRRPAIHTSPSPSVATSTRAPDAVQHVRGAEATSAADSHPHRLEDDRREAADHQRGHEAEQRRVGRARSLVEQQRRQPAAGERAAREPGQRQRAHDQALARSPTAPSARRTR